MTTLNLREMKEEAAKSEPAPTPLKTELVPREITFQVSYDAPDGQCYTADLTSKILDGEGRNLRTRLVIKLRNGMTVESLGNDEVARIGALANIATQLVLLPDWVEYWAKQDNELLAYINAVLLEHEYRYFRGNNTASEEGERKPRIRVVADALKSKPAS